ncbi:MAG: fasciclin domain-containing protein [Bacteroidaceae bacterium]|nr:fasciclin domain-containing protein [Bacteroidaceae bacterium]
MKRITFAMLASVLMLTACHEQVDKSARYVFKENTVMSYLEKYSETYSEYVKILYKVPVSTASATTLGQLLAARGHYTVFAPTNEAISAYLDTLVLEELIPEPSWDAFVDTTKRDSIYRVIAYNSIIDSGDADQPYGTYSFPITQGGEIGTPAMSDRKLTVHYGPVDDSIYIFNKYAMSPRNRDIMVLNGIIHQMEGVIAPKNITASVYLQEVIDKKKEGFLVMARCIQACGLKDTLDKIRDEVYEEKYKRGDIPDITNMQSWGVDFAACYAPQHRKYGFTIFAETDDFWRSEGLDPTAPDLLEKLVQWIQDNHQYAEEDVFTTDNHYSEEQNLLYQWTTYHILPQRMSADKLVGHFNEIGYSPSHPGNLSIAVYDIYTTMGPRRLLKLYESRESNGVYLNRFPNLDNGRKGTYHEISCDPDKEGCRVGNDDERAVLSDIVNCNIYPLDKPLAYDDNTRNCLMRQRMRFDAQTLFPECINNDIRLNGSSDSKRKYVYAPADNVYRYFENMWQGDETFVAIIDYSGGNPSMNADEIKAGGRYDVTIKLPPVPKRGTYELRYACLNRTYRGVCQVYLGKDRVNRTVTGIPIDMTKDLWGLDSGYERDVEDQDYNAEIDKRMRSLGYMKGCMSYAPSGNASQAMRINTTYSCMRQIIVRKTMDPNETYYLSFKNVLDYFKELYIDYFELCAKEVYDNPELPEDIW